MPINFNAGLSGVLTSRRVMELIGHNIANVNTSGYSRQVANLESLGPAPVCNVLIGQGVRIESIKSVRDDLVETRLRSGDSGLAWTETLRRYISQIEDFLNDSGEGGVNALLVRLYNNFDELSIRPQDTSVRLQVISDAQRLADRLQGQKLALTELQEQIPLEIEGRVTQVNSLLERLAEANRQIQQLEAQGKPANDYIDISNSLLRDLSKLVNIEVLEDEHRVRRVTLNGEILVAGDRASTVRVSDTYPEQLEIERDGRVALVTPTDGEIAALSKVRHTVIPEFCEELDRFARGLIRLVNGIHAEGIGLNGRYTSLTSENAVADTNEDGDFTNDLLFDNEGIQIQPKAGLLRITVVNNNASPPTFDRYEIPIEPAKDTLATIAQKLNAIQGMTASADPKTGKLTISSPNGYSFDFAKPTELGNLVRTDAASPKLSLSGEFTGPGTDNYSFTITQAVPPEGATQAQIGQGTITAEVRDKNGALLKVLNLGEGYIPGEALVIPNGLSVSFGQGIVQTGNSLSALVYSADTDTADILPALGINSFFSGQSADDIRVSDRIVQDPRNIAHSLSTAPGDAENAFRLTALFETMPDIPEIKAGATIAGTFQNLVQDIGERSQSLELKENTQRQSQETLQAIRASISGVSLDEEMANLMRFQQMFQASAKHIVAMNQLLQILTNL
jgi:flagellar hook-associated protein 1 FlgK